MKCLCSEYERKSETNQIKVKDHLVVQLFLNIAAYQKGESQGQGSLVGCHLWGHTELDMTEATQQQQQLIGNISGVRRKKTISRNCIFSKTSKIILICTQILKGDYRFSYYGSFGDHNSIIFLLTNHDTMILSE